MVCRFPVRVFMAVTSPGRAPIIHPARHQPTKNTHSHTHTHAPKKEKARATPTQHDDNPGERILDELVNGRPVPVLWMGPMALNAARELCKGIGLVHILGKRNRAEPQSFILCKRLKLSGHRRQMHCFFYSLLSLCVCVCLSLCVWVCLCVWDINLGYGIIFYPYFCLRSSGGLVLALKT
ncbi:hypothetical protein BX666DRAFT_538851 [Dichotomocladium elegans]|nr:hypothetical protein BX666DRAFT_538851 [Dichotomocladium elegans]